MNTINKWIESQRISLKEFFIPLLEIDIKKVLETHPNTYGYALMAGEDLEQLNVISISNTESDYLKYEESYKDEARYIVDEWAEWHQESFPSLNNYTLELYNKFRELCPENEGSEYYSDHEVYFQEQILSSYVDALSHLKNNGKLNNITFTLIYISDCGLDIINQSIKKLNSGIELKKALEVYEYESNG